MDSDSRPLVPTLPHVLQCLRHHGIYNVTGLKAIRKEPFVNTRLSNLHDTLTSRQQYQQHDLP